jgi:hypothetical protein
VEIGWTAIELIALWSVNFRRQADGFLKRWAFNAAVALATQGVSNISADERKAATEHFKSSEAYGEGERNDTSSARSLTGALAEPLTGEAEASPSAPPKMGARTKKPQYLAVCGSWPPASSDFHVRPLFFAVAGPGAMAGARAQGSRRFVASQMY